MVSTNIIRKDLQPSMKRIFSVVLGQLVGLTVDLELSVPDSIRDSADDGAEVRVSAKLAENRETQTNYY